MKTHYFLASVSNATARAVRLQNATHFPLGAMAEAANTLYSMGFHVTQLQELAETQYFAGNVAPTMYDVGICSPALTHSFPPVVTRHDVTFTNGSHLPIHVDPSETFGHALARMGFSSESVKSVAVGGDLSYEPDYACATR